MTSRLLPVQAEQTAEQPSDNLETGCPVELALNPKPLPGPQRTYLFLGLLVMTSL